MKVLVLAALFSLTGCVQWWVATSDNPAPNETPHTVTVQPIGGQVAAFTPVVAPTAVAFDNDTAGTEPPGGDGDGPTTSPAQVATTPAPTIAPAPTNAPQANSAASPSPVAYVTPGPGSSPNMPTTCAGLGQVAVTSFGRLACPQSALFTGNTPLHHRYATLMSAGLLTVQSSQLASDYWNQGGSNGKRGGDGNLYVITPGMPTVSRSTSCSDGGNGCGAVMALPQSYAIQQGNSDHHVAVMDTVRGYEIDAWGGANWPSVSSAGYYPLAGGTGILPGGVGGWTGIAGGEAIGAVNVTAQELLAYKQSGVHIGHALALLSGCVGPGAGVYPDRGQNPDSQCSSSAPAPVYGGLVHLKSSYNVANDPNASDPYCAAMEYTFQDYGGYVADTTGGQYGIYVYMEGVGSYSSEPQVANPWTTGPDLQGDNLLINNGCFSAIPASSIEVAYFSSNTPVLPPNYGYGDPRQ